MDNNRGFWLCQPHYYFQCALQLVMGSWNICTESDIMQYCANIVWFAVCWDMYVYSPCRSTLLLVRNCYCCLAAGYPLQTFLCVCFFLFFHFTSMWSSNHRQKCYRSLTAHWVKLLEAGKDAWWVTPLELVVLPYVLGDGDRALVIIRTNRMLRHPRV